MKTMRAAKARRDLFLFGPLEMLKVRKENRLETLKAIKRETEHEGGGGGGAPSVLQV